MGHIAGRTPHAGGNVAGTAHPPCGGQCNARTLQAAPPTGHSACNVRENSKTHDLSHPAQPFNQAGTKPVDFRAQPGVGFQDSQKVSENDSRGVRRVGYAIATEHACSRERLGSKLPVQEQVPELPLGYPPGRRVQAPCTNAFGTGLESGCTRGAGSVRKCQCRVVTRQVLRPCNTDTPRRRHPLLGNGMHLDEGAVREAGKTPGCGEVEKVFYGHNGKAPVV